MADITQEGERAVLVETARVASRSSMEELFELAISAGATPVATVTTQRIRPDPRFYIGTGKVDELRETATATRANLVLFNDSLSPSQERNLEKVLDLRVIDRTRLILDIFAQRAQSFEGKLQVELAQLRHQATRLVRGWTHLERQKGGIGLRGPGETQLETDKRLLATRIKQIQSRLQKVERQRQQGRMARSRASIPVVGLVGYTNAGKSTLFNRLANSSVYAADQLFATLDPTLRKFVLPGGKDVVLADTVGFIRDLPHELIAAFKSTLLETTQADLLLHVIDTSDSGQEDTIESVEAVLEEIDAADIPRIKVYNKIDSLREVHCHVERDQSGLVTAVWLSARTGEGLNLLKSALAEKFLGNMFEGRLRVGAHEGWIRAKLHELGRVDCETPDGEGGWFMDVSILKSILSSFSGLCVYDDIG